MLQMGRSPPMCSLIETTVFPSCHFTRRQKRAVISREFFPLLSSRKVESELGRLERQNLLYRSA